MHYRCGTVCWRVKLDFFSDLGYCFSGNFISCVTGRGMSLVSPKTLGTVTDTTAICHISGIPICCKIG